MYRTLEAHPEYLIESGTASRSVDDCTDIIAAIAIPVNFIVWMDEGEDIPLQENRFQMALDVVNEGFQSNGLNFRFYLYCSPQFIVDPNTYIFYDYVHLAAIGLHAANSLNALNVHVFAGQATAQNFGGVYHGPADIIGLNRDRFENETTVNTLIHEIGHYFHLQHTHLFTETPGCCMAEPVTREKIGHNPCIGCATIEGWWAYNKRCARTGDWLCDTPADPEGGEIVTVDQNNQVLGCEALPSPQFDQYGQAYVPDVYNYMSYYSRRCRSRFSNGQKGIIISQMLSNPRRAFIKAVNVNLQAAKPDKYEPDNSDANLMPSSIAVGDRQCHSMHNSLAQSSCRDNEDWLIIDNFNGMLEGYNIEISDVDGSNNPVDDVVIYNTDDQGLRTTQIPTIFSDNGATRSWQIPCDALTPNAESIDDPYDYNDFLVQINRGNNAAGFYEVELKKVLQKMPRLTEAKQVCVGSVFNVTTLEPGATVTWDSDNLTLSTTTGPSTSVVAAHAFTDFEIQAIIEYNGCTYRIKREFDEIASASIDDIGSITMDVVGNACNPQFKFSIPLPEGGTYYDWSCFGTVGGEEEHFTGCFGNVVNESQGIAYTNASAYSENGEDVIINVTVTVSNDCGVEKTKLQGFLYRPEGDCDIQGPIRSVGITPNPVNDSYFTLDIDDDTVNPEPYQIVIFDQYGNINYMLQSPDKVHQISTLNFPNGLYYAEVVGALNIATTAFYVLQ